MTRKTLAKTTLPPFEDDDAEEPDVDERNFRDATYQSELAAEFAYSPGHIGDQRPYQEEATRKLLADITPERPQLLHVATGGGKTRIANDVVTRFLEERGGPVLWVTKDWRVLWQAARDRCQRVAGAFERIGRIGGDGTVLHPLPPGSKAEVIYTTLQTVGRDDRLASIPRGQRPRLIVWDECHWGEHAKLGRNLLKWCARNKVPVLGLTATPRTAENSQFQTCFSRDYLSLVESGFLAKAVPVDPVNTHAQWDPKRANSFSDFQQDSLRELGRNQARNKMIAAHYRERAHRYGQTLVFACSIEHAEELARLFNRDHGIAARPVHSQRTNVENDEALRQFDRGEVKVLINVAKLTMGYDFPAARAIFLCRPTLSEILFAQMIGRAARLHASSGKTQFDIVEFTDSISKYEDQLVTAKRYFKGALDAGKTSDDGTSKPNPKPPPVPRLDRHEFDVRGAATWFPNDESVPESVRGLWYRQGQTFGVEIELTSDDFDPEMETAAWLPRAEAIRMHLAATLGDELVATFPLAEHHGLKKNDVWNVEWDGSAGWEVTSRVLSGHTGYIEIDKACVAIARAQEELGLRLNTKTGMHVHIGWLGQSVDEVKRSIRLARLFEPALASLVSPSRIASFVGTHYDVCAPNIYCKPVSTVLPLEKLNEVETFDELWAVTSAYEARYVTFNVKPLDVIQTVEVRMFNGTVDARKVLLWLSLWQQILWAASNESEIPDVPDRAVITPDGDIIEMAKKYLPTDHGRVLSRLHERRLEVRRLWEKRPELSAWAAQSAGWVAPSPAAPTAIVPLSLYFAYGANMSTSMMAERCPSARAVESASVAGYRLAFAGHSTRWGGGVATMTPEPDSSSRVDGLLYELPDSELAALDHIEGAKYSLVSVPVETAAGLKVARAYLMTSDAVAGAPSREYLRVLRGEYARLGFDVVKLLDAMTA